MCGEFGLCIDGTAAEAPLGGIRESGFGREVIRDYLNAKRTHLVLA